jgi:Protein of unknown function (DUF1553)
VPLLETFDVASADTPTASRTTTTIAPQALILLNSTFMDEQADAFARRLIKEGGENLSTNVERLFRLALSRPPTEHEKHLAQDYFARLAGPRSYQEALAMLCKVVLNLNELVYID